MLRTLCWSFAMLVIMFLVCISGVTSQSVWKGDPADCSCQCEQAIVTNGYVFHEYVDLLFILDSSGSVAQQTDWLDQTEFFALLSSMFDTSVMKARIAVSAYGNVLNHTLQLTETPASTEQLYSTINNTDYIGGIADIPDVLRQVNEQFETGDRLNVSNVAVFLVDGGDEYELDAVQAAGQDLRNIASVISIGIWGENNSTSTHNYVKAISSSPDWAHTVKDFKNLVSVFTSVLYSIGQATESFAKINGLPLLETTVCDCCQMSGETTRSTTSLNENSTVTW